MMLVSLLQFSLKKLVHLPISVKFPSVIKSLEDVPTNLLTVLSRLLDVNNGIATFLLELVIFQTDPLVHQFHVPMMLGLTGLLAPRLVKPVLNLDLVSSTKPLKMVVLNVPETLLKLELVMTFVVLLTANSLTGLLGIPLLATDVTHPTKPEPELSSSKVLVTEQSVLLQI